MTSHQEIEKNRDNFLKKNKKYGEDAIEKARGVSDYKELAKRIGCPTTVASTIINQLLGYELYEKGKNDKLKRTKELIIIGIKPQKTITQITEKKIITRKIKKINSKEIKKKISSYFENNFEEIPNPFNNLVVEKNTKDNLKKSAELFFEILESDLKFDRLNGLNIRFYDAFANYFSTNRMNPAEMMTAFSSLIGNFEPYIKKTALFKTKNLENAKLALGKPLIKSIIEFEDKLNNNKPDYWENKSVINSCIRHTFPYRSIEAHESRKWNIFQMERVIFYMFSAIILLNIKILNSKPSPK